MPGSQLCCRLATNGGRGVTISLVEPVTLSGSAGAIIFAFSSRGNVHEVTSKSFANDKKIPAEFAFCAPDPKTHVALSKNLNPHLQWQDVPTNAKSLALICHDPDVPSKPDDVNKEGRTISAQLPRVDFYHWVLVDLPATTLQIRPGEFSSGVKPRGKPGPESLHGTRQGLNDYTTWFASDKEMAGNYFGYDGPCPPWNDTIPAPLRLHALCARSRPLPRGRCIQGPGSAGGDQGSCHRARGDHWPLHAQPQPQDLRRASHDE